ncbi:MAG TPA: acyl-CoA dehydrogenase family protein [Candidatus Deferrimicrobiaceae bacterium]|nr:acyl-CoA dehydrogenase family protein [Candidatus Deferrimicrobiaceae bacterium]
MRFELREEQAQIREMVRSLARKEFATKAAEIDEQVRYPAENLKRLGELGLLGMLVPASYGGSETGAVAYAVALAEVAGGCASTAVGMAVTNMVGEGIHRFGTVEQKNRFLPVLASGAAPGAFALTEPSAGSDAFGISTSAVRDGEAYVLNGSKAFITNGTHAGVTIVMAVTEKEPKKRISAFLVEPGMPGFSIGKPEHKMGLKGSDTVSLSFDDCRVPVRNRLGEEGEGFAIAMSALDGGRIGIAAQSVGIARAALEAAISYATERRQFGQPLTGFQAIQGMLADSATELDAAELLALRAAYRKETGAPYTREASIAKVFASEAAYRACHRSVQIFGGYGYIREYPVERHLRDIKVTSIYEGTSEIQRIVIARNLLR